MNKRLKKKKNISKIRAEECWDLDNTLCKFIIPRLYKFTEINISSYPSTLNSTEEWHKIIDKIIWSFEFVLEKSSCSYKDWAINIERYKEGMDLFKEYLMDLWD